MYKQFISTFENNPSLQCNFFTNATNRCSHNPSRLYTPALHRYHQLLSPSHIASSLSVHMCTVLMLRYTAQIPHWPTPKTQGLLPKVPWYVPKIKNYLAPQNPQLIDLSSCCPSERDCQLPISSLLCFSVFVHPRSSPPLPSSKHPFRFKWMSEYVVRQPCRPSKFLPSNF